VTSGVVVVDLHLLANRLLLPVHDVEHLLEPLAGVTIDQGAVHVDEDLVRAIGLMPKDVAVLRVRDLLRRVPQGSATRGRPGKGASGDGRGRREGPAEPGGCPRGGAPQEEPDANTQG
jgi:hypothetical protein